MVCVLFEYIQWKRKGVKEDSAWHASKAKHSKKRAGMQGMKEESLNPTHHQVYQAKESHTEFTTRRCAAAAVWYAAAGTAGPPTRRRQDHGKRCVFMP